MKDKNGNPVAVGDYVFYGANTIGKVRSMQDPWCIDQWNAVVENIHTRKGFNCFSEQLELVDDEKAMLLKLEES
jgi:hypothetical protein